MTVLNNEILNTIFIKLMDSSDTLSDATLINFMSAGKQTFNIGLNHLRRSQKIVIETNRIGIICLNNDDIKIKCFWIHYSHPLLDAILAFVSITVNEIKIISWPNVDFAKRINLENLLFCETSKTPLSFPKFKFNNLIYRTHKKRLHALPFFNVKNLEFQGSFIYKPYSLNEEKMKLFSTYISQNFPNLKFLNVNLTFCAPLNQENLFQEIQKLKSNVFQEIPLNVKGIIQFSGNFRDASRSNINFINKAEKEKTMKIKYENKNTIITKEFLIHDGLKFEFIANFFSYDW